jgi:hypothetical protein
VPHIPAFIRDPRLSNSTSITEHVIVGANSGGSMGFKPNYNQQRAERDRAKQLKKQEKLKQQQEETARRKAAARDESPASGGDDDR